MPVLKMSEDKVLTITKLGNTYEDENNAEIIKILLPKRINYNDLSKCVIHLCMINQDGFGDEINISTNLKEYSDDFYVVDIDLTNRITYKSGQIQIWIKVLGIDNEMVAKSSSVTYQVKEHLDIENYIPEQKLSLIDDFSLRMENAVSAVKDAITKPPIVGDNGNWFVWNVDVNDYVDSGVDFTETDPTVPEWAKQPEKPSYTADEVGALPNTTQTPSVDDVNENTKARHEHSNKTVLDSIDDSYTEKWNSAYSHSISSHAPENAQENIIEDIKINGTSALISDKTVNITTPTKTSDIANDSGFVTNITNDLVNYYLKSEVYTKEEVQSLIGRISSLELIKVDELPTENIKTSAIYLLPKDQIEENNIYTEYIYMDGKWETIGDTSVDLSQYALKTEIPTKLSQLQNDANYSQFSGSYNDLNDKPTIVGDVKLSGASVVSNGVANIPVGNSARAGTYLENYIAVLENANRGGNRVITGSVLDYAVRRAMTDGKGAAWRDSEKTGAWSRLTSIKTSMDEVAVAGAQYYLGEQSVVSIVLPDDALVGQVITVVWYNGETASTLTIDGTMLEFDYTPSANSRSEISCLWDGRYWAVIGNEMAVPVEEVTNDA